MTHFTKPKNKQEMVNGIKEFWRTKMIVEQCTRCINHIHRVIPVIIAKNGEPMVDDEIRSHTH